ncbi:MAG: ParB/RepB/Spo0J family partition protein [Proteobacteria bacterium]|jgi:ParB family transcriptional regulator, chromosome partitioning protein|nr:ParB/RepB/Spo0J family partition protein [Pseudomonadota bacterium]
MTKEKRLGRGLSALFENELEENELNESEVAGEVIQEIAIDKLISGKFQPRKSFSQQSIKELSDSIVEQGLLQPIIVRKVEKNVFEIIAGERRWRAAQLAKLDAIPAIVRNINDRSASIISLIENMQREDLTAIEEAEGIQKMIYEFGMTHEAAADAVGKSRSSVTNLLRLLLLSDFVKEKLNAGNIDMGHARALLSLPPDQQNMICQKIIQENLSVRKVESLINENLNVKKSKKPIGKIEFTNDLKNLEKELSEQLGYIVSIDHKPNNSGQIKIKYRNLDELDVLLKNLKLKA